MKGSYVILTVLIFCIGMLGQGTLAQEKSCKAVLSDMTKMQMTMMSKCGKSLGFKNAKEKAARSMCIMKCVLSDVGMLNEKGSTDAATAEKVAGKFFAVEGDRLHAIKTLTPCMEQHAAVMDNTEENCKSYEPFVKCLMGSIMNMCPPS